MSKDRRPVLEVVPLVRLPRQHRAFDYLTPAGLEDLTTGDLVKVNFRGRTSLGVVVGRKQSSSLTTPLKPVLNLVAKQYINEGQLDLASWLAQHYGIALSSALKVCLSVLPNRNYQPGKADFPLVVKKSNKAKAYLFISGNNQNLVNLVNSLVTKVLARQQQVLFLVPTKNDLVGWQTKLAGFPTQVFIPDDKTAQQRQVWEACRSGEVAVIMGTRSALFLPYVNLGGIVMLGAEDENYKQWDQNPRYNSLEIAQWLSRRYGVNLALISSAPSLTMWQEVKQGRYWARNLTTAIGKIKVIDMKASRRFGETNIISGTLYKEINKRLSEKQKIFLYLNRRGTATAVVCRDCGFLPVCQVCQRALVWHGVTNQLACYHCNLLTDPILPCPLCRGHNIDYKGLGIDKLVMEVNRLWPEVKPLIIEGEDYKPSPANLTGQLIIGSQAGWSRLDLTQISLVAFISPDGELAIPEFRASELVWQKANKVLSSGASLVVQTHRPNNYVWQSLVKNKPELFYEAEKIVRAQYLYPPVVELVRFIIQAHSQRRAQKQAQEVHKKLQAILPPGATLSPVYLDYYRQVRGQYRYHILLKYQAGSKISELWAVLPDEVIIDRQPLTILS